MLTVLGSDDSRHMGSMTIAITGVRITRLVEIMLEQDAIGNAVPICIRAVSRVIEVGTRVDDNHRDPCSVNPVIEGIAPNLIQAD